MDFPHFGLFEVFNFTMSVLGAQNSWEPRFWWLNCVSGHSWLIQEDQNVKNKRKIFRFSKYFWSTQFSQQNLGSQLFLSSENTHCKVEHFKKTKMWKIHVRFFRFSKYFGQHNSVTKIWTPNYFWTPRILMVKLNTSKRPKCEKST